MSLWCGGYLVTRGKRRVTLRNIVPPAKSTRRIYCWSPRKRQVPCKIHATYITGVYRDGVACRRCRRWPHAAVSVFADQQTFAFDRRSRVEFDAVAHVSSAREWTKRARDVAGTLSCGIASHWGAFSAPNLVAAIAAAVDDMWSRSPKDQTTNPLLQLLILTPVVAVKHHEPILCHYSRVTWAVR